MHKEQPLRRASCTVTTQHVAKRPVAADDSARGVSLRLPISKSVFHTAALCKNG